MSEKVAIGVDLSEIQALIKDIRELQSLASQGLSVGGGPLPSASVPSATVTHSSGGMVLTNAAPPVPSVPATALTPAAAGLPPAQHAQAAATPSTPPSLPSAFAPPGTPISMRQAYAATASGATSIQIATPPAPMATYAQFGTYGVGPGGGFAPLSWDPLAGMWVDPSTGTYVAGSYPGGGSGSGSARRTPIQRAGGGFLASIGGMAAVYQGSQAANAMAGGFGEAAVQGTPYYWQRYTPEMMTLGGIVGGAIIGGSIAGPPGAGIGATIGGLATTIGGSALRPAVERWANERTLRQAAFRLNFIPSVDEPWNGLTEDMIQAVSGGLGTGRYLPRSVYDTISGIGAESPVIRKILTDSLIRAAYSSGSIARRGLPTARGAYSLADRRDILLDDAYGNELETAQALTAEGLYKVGARVRQSFVDRTLVEGRLQENSGRSSLADASLQLATKYRGSRGALDGSVEFTAAANERVGLLRDQASLMRRGGHVFEARAKEYEAQQLEMQARYAPLEAYFSALGQENSAKTALQQGSADRSFTAARYSGQSSATLPWESRASASRDEAARLRSEMAAKAAKGMLSPAEGMSYQEKIQAAEFQASVGIAKEREEMRNREISGRASLSSAQYTSSRIGSVLRGDAVTQAGGQIDIQVQNLERQRAALEQIVSTSKMLTYEQKLQLETAIAQSKADQQRLQVTKELVESEARVRTAGTTNLLRRNDAEIRLIKGLGGAAAEQQMGEILGSIRSDMSTLQKEREHFISLGYSPKSPKVQEIDRQISDLRVQEAQQRQSMAVAPISPQLAGMRSDLDTAYRLAQSGFGSYGDLRGLLKGRIGVERKYLDELDAGRREAMKTGEWTPAMEAAYKERRNQTVLGIADLQMEFNQGWDQRVLSEAYNMPTGINGQLALNRFSRREAAGILHMPWLGGTEADSQRWQRSAADLMMGIRGTGSPEGFAQRALGGAKGPLDLRIALDVTVNGNGTAKAEIVGPNSSAFVRDQAVKVWTTNTNAQKTPSG